MKFKFKFFCIVLTITFFYCEFLADYFQLFTCSWPVLNVKQEAEENVLSAMLLADTHILGPKRGHWLDKLYREWHMHRAFQAALQLFRPEVVFVLGDLFDEGDLIDHQQFQEHVVRFHKHFQTPKGTPIISAVGNHDIGFHYRLHPYFAERFESNFNNTGVRVYSMKNVHFVVINSMAMENDGCYFCENAVEELKKISAQLKCLQAHDCDKSGLSKTFGTYSRPIVMQHFPTYRSSDDVCLDRDGPNTEKYRENWEVLSKASTDMIGELLKPRLAFAGHSHHYCLNKNRWNVEEYTIASFNWRNKINPSFILAKFTQNHYVVSKCDMLKQEHVYNVYLIAATLIIMYLTTYLLKLMSTFNLSSTKIAIWCRKKLKGKAKPTTN